MESKFYATGTKKQKNKITGETETISVVIPLTETSRILAEKQAARVARRERIALDGILPYRNRK